MVKKDNDNTELERDKDLSICHQNTSGGALTGIVIQCLVAETRNNYK